MIYVFDDDEEMNECCGCPISSGGIASFSVENNLISNSVNLDHFGAIAVVAAAQNDLTTAAPNNGKFCPVTASAACNLGCDPTNNPGYTVTPTNNLLGSMTESGGIVSGISGVIEIPLFNDAGGDPTNLLYLRSQCGALVGNSSGAGICNCPPGG